MDPQLRDKDWLWGSGWLGFEQEAGVATGWPGQVLRGELGPVHVSPWILFALRSSVHAGVSVRPPINDQLRTGTNKGNPDYLIKFNLFSLLHCDPFNYGQVM